MRTPAAVVVFAALVLSPLLPAASVRTASAEPPPHYDKAKVLEVTGVVTGIDEAPATAVLPGVHLLLRTDKSTTLDVYVGPAAFVRSFGISFSTDEDVRATGSKVKVNGHYVLLAREIQQRNATAYLRDDNGDPLWPAESHQ